MKLQQLIEGAHLNVHQGHDQTAISDLVDDSRLASPGCAFIARSGSQNDGRRFVHEAIERGAVAVIGSFAADWDLPRQIAVACPSQDMNVDQNLTGRIAARFFGEPAKNLKLLGITGTNGKTTTACISQYLLNQLGIRSGLIGTVLIDYGEQNSAGTATKPAQLTTPGVIDVHRILARMVTNGCQAAVIEVSSHALDQNRIAGLDFHTAIFTNLTGDHLDYHGSMARYAQAKTLLFTSLSSTAWAILNGDDPYSRQMAKTCGGRITWTTLNNDFTSEQTDQRVCQAAIQDMTTAHSRVQIDGPWGSVQVQLPLIGRHNVANALQAAAAVNTIAALDRKTLRCAFEQCPSVPGRLELVSVADADASPTPQPTVLVDYAHTHDALENVLQTLRPLCRGRLIVLFGCGGDRDKTKRPKMAQVATQLADKVVITSDNPRTENPAEIIRNILAGLPPSINVIPWPAQQSGQSQLISLDQHQVFIDEDRASAIRRCVLAANVDDTLLLAGKGHEDYQITAAGKRHFDDREHAGEALEHWIEEYR
jgi:UDP-N-acetylmuramoyl-L-alanyl-D-glutamate--2,6-diaminopimelate ligase